MSKATKSEGITYLRRVVAKRNKKLNYICLPLDKAEEILRETMTVPPSTGGLSLRSNSVKAASVLLCVSPEELIERMKFARPAELLNQLAEAKNKIYHIEVFGDVMAEQLGGKYKELWEKAKKPL